MDITKDDVRYYTSIALTLGLVILIGLLSVNQFLEYKYRAEFLGSPCGLCAKLNPNLKQCLVDASTVTTSINNTAPLFHYP